MNDKTEGFEITIGPKKAAQTAFKEIPLHELHFYPKNPRISSILMNYGEEELTDDIIYQLMEKKQHDAVSSLYQQVKKDGRINEPLTVYENKTLEGNTRLWVAKRLYSEAKNEEERKKWEYLPCRVITQKLSQDEIDYILCNYHIKKKKDWSPYETACYFYRMKTEEKRTYQEISKLTGYGAQKISDYIKTFSEIKMRKLEPTHWSAIYETVKMPEVKKTIKEEGIDVVDIIEKQIRKGEIKDARDVRKLKIILKDKKVARKKLLQGTNINRAYKIAQTTVPAESDAFLHTLKETAEVIENLQKEKIEEIKNNPRKLAIVREFIETVNKYLADEFT